MNEDNKNSINWNASWEEITDEYQFLKTNKYITKGYRIGLQFNDCIFRYIYILLYKFSYFRLHNELINILSHTIGFIIILICLLHCYKMNIYSIKSIEYYDYSSYGISLITNGKHDLSLLTMMIKPSALIDNLQYSNDNNAINLYQKSIKSHFHINHFDCDIIRNSIPKYANFNDTEIIKLYNHNKITKDIEELVIEELSHTYSLPTKTNMNLV